jgi:cathepsin C
MEPSNEDSSYLAQSPYEYRNTYKLQLKSSNEAAIEMEGKLLTGKWTMVYDEGFNIQIDQFTFFSFSKYSIDKENGKKIYKSHCYSTLVGWFNNHDKSKWGCYQAFKLGVDPTKVTLTNSKNNLNIVEPQKSTVNDDILNSMFNMQFKSINSEILFNNDDNIDRSTIKNKFSNKKNRLRISKYQPSSFLEEKESTSSMSMMKLDASFNNHALYISRINTLKKSWNAGLHPKFSNMSIRELNKYAGIPRIGNNFRFKSKSELLFKAIEDVSMYPKNFDWKQILKPAGSQGDCGSCYVYSTVRMIEARLKIKYNHEVNLSVQHALDCSFYNQGCNGGYPYLVMKFANEFQMIPETCKPYTQSDGKCNLNVCDISTLPYVYKTTDYKYIGGTYGECSQKKMMEELKNGPIVVSFEPDYNFMMYKSGIYHAFDLNTWITKGLPKPEWQKVDHSVLLVGWGEEESSGEKFWIIQNTWGPSWGEEGFFRMRRGSDEFGIESICEASTPVVINNQTGQIITDPNEIKSFSFTKQDSENASIFDVFK